MVGATAERGKENAEKWNTCYEYDEAERPTRDQNVHGNDKH
jgi:hypothetical protein